MRWLYRARRREAERALKRMLADERAARLEIEQLLSQERAARAQIENIIAQRAEAPRAFKTEKRENEITRDAAEPLTTAAIATLSLV